MKCFLTIFLGFLLIQPGICFDKESPWRIIAVQALEEFEKAISENHPGLLEDKNPYFKKWFKKGYQEGKKLAEKTSTFDEYYYLTKKSIHGFKYGHLSYYLTLERTTLKWPGFLLTYRGNKFIVHSVSGKMIEQSFLLKI